MKDLYKEYKKGNFKYVERNILSKKLDINKVYNDGNTLLMIVCYTGNLKILSKILEREDLDINLMNMGGNTGLHYACHMGHLECVNRLLSDNRIEVNIQSERGSTPLYCVREVIRKNPDTANRIIVALLLKGADITYRQSYKTNKTILYFAAIYGCKRTFSNLLLSFKDDISKMKFINNKDSVGQILIQDLIKDGADEWFIKELIIQGSNIFNQNNVGYDCMDYCKIYGRESLGKMFEEMCKYNGAEEEVKKVYV